MYKNNEKGFALTDVILQLLFLVLFIFILIWLFPTKGFVEQKQVLGTNAESTDYSVLYQNIFNENLNAMKEAAKSYYTTPRLPKNIGDKVSMTLGEMLDKKIILPFKDRNGESCNLEKSYVEITKEDEEFQLKVMLSCSNEEEYMIVHLGCYQYCEDGICEKTNDNRAVVSTVSKPVITERPIINNNITINNNCVDCNPSKPVDPVYYCQYINGKYYGKDGSIVSEATYKKECTTPEQPKNLYYEYRTKTLIPYRKEIEMCNYYATESKSENIYTLGYTPKTVADINRYPYAVKLPAGATNVTLKNFYYGKENFDVTKWNELKRSGKIYNYERNDSNISVKDTVTSTNMNRSGLSNRHINKVDILKTSTTSYNNYVEFKIDYRVTMNRNSIASDMDLVTYHDSNVGNIYYVPIKFYISYNVVSSKTSTKACSNLTSEEKKHIASRYTTYETYNNYQYGPYQWTTNPNLTGVEYTGKTEYR